MQAIQRLCATHTTCMMQHRGWVVQNLGVNVNKLCFFHVACVDARHTGQWHVLRAFMENDKNKCSDESHTPLECVALNTGCPACCSIAKYGFLSGCQDQKISVCWWLRCSMCV